MCRSRAPSRISIIERIENPELGEEAPVFLPFFQINGGMPPLDEEVFYEEGEEIDSQFQLLAFNYDEEDEFPDSREEERQANVYRGLERPRDDEDWRLISERFRAQMYDVTGVMIEFSEWRSAYEEEENDDDFYDHSEWELEEFFMRRENPRPAPLE